MTLVLRYAARSDVGLIRAGNEDSAYAGPTLLVVADGMGGHAAGELASAAAVATFAALSEGWARHGDDDGPDLVLEDMAEGVSRTTAEIGRVVSAQPELAGMGTTLTALAWHSGRIALAHVGDSRAYLLRQGRLSQLTVDHTYVQMLVDTGRITAEEALTHARRNLIMRAIDGVNDVQPDLSLLEAEDHDRYLLCSDGLSGVVPESELRDLLATGDATYVVGALVERAIAGGAPDNVTVVVADVVSVDSDDAATVALAQPVVVGAAGERRNREQLAGLAFPDDAEPDLASVVPPDTSREPVEIGASGSSGARRPADSGGARHRGHRSTSWIRPLLLVVVVVVVLAAVTTVALQWARSQYYVGVSDGKVTIFQGLSQSVAGVSLSQPFEPSGIDVTALPPLYQQQLQTPIPAADLEQARRIVANYSALLGCSASPVPTGCASSTGTGASSPALPSPAPTVAPTGP